MGIIVLEANRFLSIPLVKSALKFQLAIEEWVALFSKTWGRGVLYIFEGTLLCAYGGWMSFVVAVFLVILGMFAIVISMSVGKKLDDLKQRMMGVGDPDDKEWVIAQFNKFDVS